MYSGKIAVPPGGGGLRFIVRVLLDTILSHVFFRARGALREVL
jgi:hypothetical protein